ncbi:MAG: GEVED domain-containing protein [Planctomycetaceae bacterium]
MLISTWIKSFRRQLQPRPRRIDRRRSDRSSKQSELLETRALLAAPTLIDVESGTGKMIAEDSVISFSPDELVLNFDSVPDLDPATVSSTTVFVETPGADGAFDGNDVVVPVTFVGIGANPNEVLLQFGQSLKSDLYRITIQGAVANTNAEPFNGGTDDTFGFEIDLPTPTLIAAKPNEGQFLNLDPLKPTTILSIAPREITLQFQPGDILDPATISTSTIQVERAGFDGDFDNGTTRVPVGWVGIGDSPEEVILRFAENLPDDDYRIVLDGDGTNLDSVTVTPITTVLDEVLGDGVDTTVNFELELGARVVAVVPQPITRNGAGALTQRRDQIVLYLNDDDLDLTSVETREFYQLIATMDTLDPSDDVVYLPKASGGVVYDSASDTITLTFDSNIYLLAGQGSYRLRVGVFDTPVSSTVTVPSAGDDNSSFLTAQNLGTLTADTISVTAAIEPQTVLTFPELPSSEDEPGHRDIAPESHIGGADTNPAIPVVTYYFPDEYGTVLGQTVFNQITAVQKERAREVFELFSEYAGVQFVELSSRIVGAGDIAVITGDPRAIDPAVPQGAVSLAGSLQGSGATAAIMNGFTNYGESEYGGGWFTTAMHEIGHTLGLGHAYDLPSIMGAGLAGFSGNPVEPVFPGDHDITHLQRLYRPDSTDIDMYSFTLSEPGRFTAEVIAERAAASSQLDSVLRLYDSSGTLIAQNDDYFSVDSFIGVDLEAGTYYVGVSSTGNTAYDPSVSDTGANGLTQGSYELRFDFDRQQTEVLVDAAGTPLDGDSDGIAGGVFEYWLTASSPANTIYIDKANAADGAQDGSLAHPYANIDDGLAAVSATTRVVRVVGNGGADGDALTTDDNVPYLIGRNDAFAVLPDGADIKVPKGVTMMVDAGAIFKMQLTHIDVGSSAQGIDRSNGAFQTLGTPENNVIFTSYGNDAIGGDSDGVTDGAAPGDYAGIVFRNDSDREENGIFLNHIQQTDFTHGGGQNFAGEVFAPIRTETARPTIMYNRFTQNAFAAISADPNSFEDSLNRIGPDIQFNFVNDNTINGLLIRTDAGLGQEGLERLDVPARMDDFDITHILTDNLLISGTPGGLLDGMGRTNGRLQIDPGVVFKVERSRIEATRGDSQLIAEGTPERQIIFTSLRDDRYGAGGTFDSSGDGSDTTPAPGDWGGLIFNAGSSASLDNVYLAHGGGRIPIEGNFDQFNAIEIHQADVRIAQSRIERNASGRSDTNRNGRGSNDATTIFVRGAQPIIVGNDFRDNLGSVISINANSMQSHQQGDYGKTTGLLQAFTQLEDNYGPLIRLNTYRNNALNAMDLRGEELTTEVIVDDFDIVHVLTDEIYIDNLHTYGGMRLISSQDGSLVFKLAGTNAGITANGKAIDIDDRIGGTLQILGNGQYPVIFTSLFDDSIGAGFGPDGLPVTDTNNDGGATTPAPGDWRSLSLQEFANDRNVRLVQENERVLTEGKEQNGVPVDAEVVGVLAPAEKHGDDNRALGIEIFGSIGLDNPGDVDIYKFEVDTGTEVWFDLDRTGSSLNSVLELVLLDGTVIASSGLTGDGSLGGIAMPLTKHAYLGPDYYTVNPRDEGFRAVLPIDPAVGVKQEAFYVRVRSFGGLTSGEYELEIRLQQRDEKAGSTIQYADVSYATNGIEVIGLPRHSPLLGEAGEAGDASNTFGGAQTVGDLLVSDRKTLSIAGNVTAPGDIDWYRFDLGYEYIQSIGGVNGGPKTFSTIFDIDYADGLTRGDLTLSVFDQNGNLILVSRDSDIIDDQPAPGEGQDIDDLTRGSFGKADPFIGPVQLPAATPGQDLTYFVAVSSNAQLPSLLNQTYTLNSLNPLVRLEPIDSIDRLIEDHIGFTGWTSGSSLLGVFNSIQPTQGGLFDTTTRLALDTYVKPFELTDVVLFVSAGDRLMTVDPFTGSLETNIGALPGGASGVADIEFRDDGRLYGYHDLPGAGNTVGRVIEIDSGNAGFATYGDDSIPDDAMANPRNFEQVTSDDAQAMAWRTNDVDSDDDAADFDLFLAVPDAVVPGTSVLYRADPTNASAAVQQGQPWGRVGAGGQTISGPGVSGRTTGMVFSGGRLYGVNNNGQLYTISTATGGATLVRDFSPLGFNFTDITRGPQNVEGGIYSQMLFATTSGGQMVAFDTAGNLQGIFSGGASSVTLGVGGTVTGLAFSPLDFNLWHVTQTRGGDAGHGINTTSSSNRVTPADFGVALPNGAGSRPSNEGEGGASFYFGLDEWVNDPAAAQSYFDYGTGAQTGTTSGEHQQLTANPAIGNNYNLPGGAFGALVSGTFDLSAYSRTDKPTLYFNYFLDTQNAAGTTTGNTFRDSARVYVYDGNTDTYFLVATNNSALSPATNPNAGELPTHITASGAIQNGQRANQRVQELFDDSGTWRQARIDLADFAGRSNLQLRFDFSTSGDSEDGLPGDARGNRFNPQKGQNNAEEGFYIDDIIIGLTERGEAVTGPARSTTTFFQTPQNPVFGDPVENLTGRYQLEIREGAPYVISSQGVLGDPISKLLPDLAVARTFDTNDRLIPDPTLPGSVGELGDQNAHRDQGQILIENNSVHFAANVGILVDAAVRDADGLASPGSPRNFDTLNNQRLTTGVTIKNNIVDNFGTTGIRFSGDNAAGGPAAVPFGKLVNNTVYGGLAAAGTGIQIDQNASPTLLNNIVANTSTAIAVDASSSSTVVGTSLFQGNGAIGALGTDAIQLAAGAPLFVDPANGNFYLESGSLAIDSSLNNLVDRPAFTVVKNPLDIPNSDVLAPDLDRFGQIRLDDPNQDPAPGLGQNIFKDRGAVERADFIGPTAILLHPEDNGIGDNDPVDHEVDFIVADFLTEFVVQLLDGGIGIADSLINPGQFALYLDQNPITDPMAVPLVEGQDYQLVYNPVADQVIFQAVTVFATEHRYFITLDRDMTTGIRDLAGNILQSNRPTGGTYFGISLTDGINDPPINIVPADQTTPEDTPLVFSVANGNQIAVSDADVHLGDNQLTVTLTATNGRITLNGAVDDVTPVPGLSFTTGDGWNDVTMTFKGTVPAINAALEGLSFLGDQDFFGLASLRILTEDNGQFSGTPISPNESDDDTVAINVTPVNDDPTFDPLTDPSAVDEDAGPQSISNFVTNIAPGPANESAQTVSFNVTVMSTTGSFSVAEFFTATGAPAIDSAGTLTFTTAPDVNGTAIISVVAEDSDGGLSDPPQTFTLTVNPLNDAPEFTLNDAAFTDPPTDSMIDGVEDSGTVVVDLVDAFAAGPATAIDEVGNQLLTWVTGTPTFTGSLSFSTFSVDANGNLTYQPTADTSGTATFTLALQDDGATGAGNVNISAARTITINVVGTPDPPVPATPDYVIDRGDTLLLDASGTFDPDVADPGDLLAYQWDLNGDGDFTDVAGISTTSPTISVPYSVLTSLGLTAPSVNPITLRVTDSFAGTSVDVGAMLTIRIVDYGDAPNTYGTLKSAGGAAHTIVSGVYLGSGVDDETDGIPGTAATGDDLNQATNDEDGVVIDPLIQRSATLDVPSFVTVTASVAGKVDVWLDLNGNGQFDHATEHVNGGASFDVVQGTNRLDFTIPAGAFGSGSVQTSYLRVRFSTAGGLLPTGRADDGEVEDYQVTINPLVAAVQPTVIRPAGPETSDLTPTIAWNDLPENYFYDVVLRDAAGTPIQLATRTQDTSVVVPSNLANGTYTVEVTPYNKVDQPGPTSAPYTFVVKKLVVSSPSGDIGDNTPTVAWNQILGTQNYQLVINSLSTGVDSIVNELSLSGGATSFTVPTALELGRYEVLVRAIDSAGDPGDWSDPLEFTVRTAPVIVNPTGVITGSLPLLQWTAVPGALSYNIVLDNLTDNIAPVLVRNGLSTTSFQVTQALPMGRYAFRVEGVSAPDVTTSMPIVGFQSPAGAVFTLAPVPVAETPMGNLDDSTPTISWQAIPGADQYEVTVRRDFGDNAVVAGPAIVDAAQYTVPTPLPLGRYAYQIRAINRQVTGGSGGDVTSAASTAVVFTVTTAPIVTMPNTSIYDTTPTVTWTAPTGSIRHEVWINDEATHTRVFYAPDTAGTSIDTTALPPGNYRVWVRSFADAAHTIASGWSTGKPFRIGTPPQNLQPGGRTTDSTPTLTWEGSLGGENYEVWLSSTTSSGRILLVTELDSAAYTVPDALPVGKYRFWVRATSGFGEKSAWSQAHDFEVVTAPAFQSFGPTTFDTTPTFNWNSVTRTLSGVTTTAQRYEVWLDNVTSGQVNVLRNVPTSPPTSTSYTVETPLAPGSYVMWVRAFVAGTNTQAGTTVTAWSAPYRFDVGGRPVVDPVASTSNPRPDFTWQPVGGAASYEVFVALTATPTTAVVREAELTTTSFTPTSDLPVGEYSVWVRATSDGGVTSAWSRAQTFEIIALTAPTVTPIGTTSDRTPTFTWSEVPGAHRYEIFIARAATPTVPLIQQGNLIPTSFTPVTNLAPGAYRVWVRAISASGVQGPWSAFEEFTVVSSDITGDDSELPQLVAFALTGPTVAAEPTMDAAISMLPARIAAPEQAPVESTAFAEPSETSKSQFRDMAEEAAPVRDVREEAVEITDALMSEWDREIWAAEAEMSALDDTSAAEASTGLVAAALLTNRRSFRRRRTS